MLYQLKNGNTINISTSDFLSMTEAELDALEGMPQLGQGIQDPMHGSAIRGTIRHDDVDPTYSEYNIQDVPLEERLRDQDVDRAYDDEDI
jgi:hypothetical protein